jgi:hypothetical protein
MTYSNNIGFQEMIQFTQKATASQQAQMDQVVRDENWAEYKELIATVLNIKLMGE